MQKELDLLKLYEHRITRQQYRTFKGQILSGDIDGFRTGLFRLINRENNEKNKKDRHNNNTNAISLNNNYDNRK